MPFINHTAAVPAQRSVGTPHWLHLPIADQGDNTFTRYKENTYHVYHNRYP